MQSGFVPLTNSVQPRVVVIPPGNGTVLSLSGSNNSSFDATVSTVTDTAASLERRDVVGLLLLLQSPLIDAGIDTMACNSGDGTLLVLDCVRR